MAGRLDAQTKQALKDANLMPEFQRIRESLTAEGMPPDEAREEALRRLAPQLPADALPEEPPDPVGELTRADFAHLDKQREPNEIEIIKWIFNHWPLSDLEPKDAPSVGAWGWLTEIRQDRDVRRQFFRDVYPKLLPSAKEMADGRRTEDDCSGPLTILDEIEQISNELRESHHIEEPV